MGLVTLQEKEEREIISLCCVMTQQEGGHLQARKRALTRTLPCWHPDLRLSASRTETKYCSVV